MVMRVEGTKLYHDAEWAQGEVSYSLISNAYVTLYSNTGSNDFLAVHMINETNQPVYMTFDATKNEHYIKSYSQVAIALGNLNRKHNADLKVKSYSTWPTTGFVRAELLKR